MASDTPEEEVDFAEGIGADGQMDVSMKILRIAIPIIIINLIGIFLIVRIMRGS